MSRGYTRDYYDRRYQETVASARTILGILFEVISPTVVMDVGCGVGAWLSVARELGAKEVIGVDGPWVDQDLLVIDRDEFIELELDTRRLAEVAPEDAIDLAICLEVAEHLYEDRAELLVRDLASSAPVVLFSAAVPGQGGTGHVHERWQSYWVDQFGGHGFRVHDLVRPRVWDDDRIKWWYRQNTLVFSRRPLDGPDRVGRPSEDGGMISVVHPEMAARGLDVYGWGRSLIRAVGRRALSRLPWRGSGSSFGGRGSGG